jgi:hypothetical protein
MSFSISKKAGSIHLHFPKNMALSHACLKVDTVAARRAKHKRISWKCVVKQIENLLSNLLFEEEKLSIMYLLLFPFR